ncbi:hypothetical protein BST96_05930 [Oceanicoccus sagamiensis]|uniref:Uncharacterized protein n=1 Tax=Oceanicoccus sagamiensis TaxID=716816 RepID=A0A1X9N9D5_9GAMM|nr:hypothetical protein BST96_05930 [Oceanicoccus sagamiensis]
MGFSLIMMVDGFDGDKRRILTAHSDKIDQPLGKVLCDGALTLIIIFEILAISLKYNHFIKLTRRPVRTIFNPSFIIL